jgi:hypothetical protein
MSAFATPDPTQIRAECVAKWPSKAQELLRRQDQSRTGMSRFHGILGPAAKDGGKVVPQPPLSQPKSPPQTGGDTCREIDTSLGGPRYREISWSFLA